MAVARSVNPSVLRLCRVRAYERRLSGGVTQLYLLDRPPLPDDIAGIAMVKDPFFAEDPHHQSMTDDAKPL